MTRRSVLLISPEVVGERMAGPALRYWYMAETLALHHDVTLAIEDRTDLSSDRFEIRVLSGPTLRSLLGRADVVVTQGNITYNFPQVTRSQAPLVVDLYDAFHIESFESYRHESPVERGLLARYARDVIRDQISRGDFFLCASERQRTFWLGHLALAGRLTPEEHDRDPTFRKLIDVAPFGISADPPRPGEPVLKGRRHGIGRDDLVVLWAGGLYDWLDPLTVIRAFASIEARFPSAHLVFLGGRHPNPAIPPARIATRAAELVDALAVPRVHFHDEWVPFTTRGSVLLEADIGVSAHPDSLEASLAFRTRLLDHIWAGLPTVATGGDELADVLAESEAGLTVAPGDVDGMSHALAELLDDRELRASAGKAAQALAPSLTWERQLAPLASFVSEPRPSAGPAPTRVIDRLQRFDHLSRRLASYLRAHEFRLAANRVRSRLRSRGRHW